MTVQATPWHPRGTPTWPDWKKAVPGTRVAHVRSGHTGTFVCVGNAHSKNAHAVVVWDDTGFGQSRANVVAPAFDLRVVANTLTSPPPRSPS